MVEKYLKENHQFGLASYTGKLELEHLNTLLIADEFDLESLLNDFMANLKETHFDVDQLRSQSSFENLSKEVRYEMIKTQIQNGTLTTLRNDEKIDLAAIFNFFDLLMYEDRVIDHFPKRKFCAQRPLRQDEFSIYEELKKEDFSTKTFFTDLAIKVDNSDTRLYVNSFVLSESSPVFAKRLEQINTLTKSNAEPHKDKVLELPWMDLEEFLLLLTFLYKNRSIDRKYFS